jgi:integrase
MKNARGYYSTGPDRWVVQASAQSPDGKRIRLCQRIAGSESTAKALRKSMLAQIHADIRAVHTKIATDTKRQEAAQLLGITLDAPPRSERTPMQPLAVTPTIDRRPTLSEYLAGRWGDHCQVAQKAHTRKSTASHISYLDFYLGELPVDEVTAGQIARMREILLREGPRCFRMARNGEPRKPRTKEFTNRAINRITGTLMAALRLAEREGTIPRAPNIDLLPVDRSEPIKPPSDEEFADILEAARKPRFLEVAPFMAEAIKLAAWTGLRAGEQFVGLTWGNVDFSLGTMGALKVQRQDRIKMADGKAWVPKNRKPRTVPMSPDTRELLLGLRERVPHGPDDPLIPNRGGSPYVRLEAAPDRYGIGHFRSVVKAAGISRRVRWHDLRHRFATKGLLAGVPLAVMSRWLGHSSIQLTVDTYGQWGDGAPEQWEFAKLLSAGGAR